MRDKHDFLGASRTVTINDRVFLAMEASAITNLIPVASIMQSTRVAVISNGKYFAEIGTCDDRSYLKSFACGPFRQCHRESHVNLLK
jgi:hypothetical protein